MRRMNTEVILETAQRTLAGTISFPEVVKALLATGVELYQVDFVTRRKTFYSAHGSVAVTAIDYESLPPIAPEFDVAALQANILDSQKHEQKFRDFSSRAMRAGVIGYFAFLRGQRVTYFGRKGDQHTEWFPGAKPSAG